jgi:hypothetical protein
MLIPPRGAAPGSLWNAWPHDGGKKHMYVGKPGATFRDHLGHVPGGITADAGGYADFETQGGKVSVWVEQ